MAHRQHWATVDVPVDLLAYPGSPRNPRADDPLMGYKYGQAVAFLRAIRGETTDYPTFRDGAEAQPRHRHDRCGHTREAVALRTARSTMMGSSI